MDVDRLQLYPKYWYML